jgi:hypothetical protein
LGDEAVIFDPVLDFFRGKAVTIPPMDGAFRPNNLIDDAPLLAALPAPDNLVSAEGRLLASSGNAVLSIVPGAEPQPVASFDAPVTALAVSPAGELAVALESGKLFLDGKELGLPRALNCITALTFRSDGVLFIANGSGEHAPSEWAADLMRKGSSGSLWGREPDGGAFRDIAGGLAFPNGLLVRDDAVVVSESWRHRLVRFDRRTGSGTTLVDHLPGYPARLAQAADGGAWLAVFAPRNRLVEFVLQEDDYRADMLAEVPREHWIAPALSSRRSFLEPLQCGAIKTMGVHKPWSPSRSYGMVVKLDGGLRPVFSLHSRADGVRHGICSALEHDGRLIVAPKGGDCLVAVDVPRREKH